MKVLLLHQHFNTPYAGGAIRSWYLAKALVDAGHEVIVLTGSNKPAVIDAYIDGIKVFYLPVPYENRFGFYKRSISFVRFVRDAVRFAEKFSDSNVCYAISVPLTVGVAAMRIKKKYKIPFVFEVGDLWPEAPVEMGFVKNPLLKSVLFGLEKKIYQSAVGVVGLSDPIADSIRKKNPDVQVAVIPNMSDTEFFSAALASEVNKEKFGARGKFVISYIGALGVANGLLNMIELSAACKREGLPIHILICGEGAMRSELESKILKGGISNISLLPFTNREGVREILRATDAAFISFQPYQILTTGSPNKYFDALAAGKMIITNFGGWVRDEVMREHLGFSFDSGNALMFLEKIKTFLNDPEKVRKCGLNARALAERKYSRKLLSHQFVRLIEDTQTSFPGK